MKFRIGFQDATESVNPAADAPHVPVQLTSVLPERFFADKPFKK